MRHLLSINLAKLIRNDGRLLCNVSGGLSKCYYSEYTVGAKEEKSRMFRYLQTKMKACGPVTVAEYMKEALTHPTEGYYMKKDVFGSQGDFTTSPEISQLFGEVITHFSVHDLVIDF